MYLRGFVLSALLLGVQARRTRGRDSLDKAQQLSDALATGLEDLVPNHLPHRPRFSRNARASPPLRMGPPPPTVSTASEAEEGDKAAESTGPVDKEAEAKQEKPAPGEVKQKAGFKKLRDILLAPLPKDVKEGFTQNWPAYAAEDAPKGATKSAKKDATVFDEGTPVEPLPFFRNKYTYDTQDPSDGGPLVDVSKFPDADLPWANLGGPIFKDPSYEPDPIESSRRLTKAEGGGPLPPLLTKSGVDYVKDNGIGEYVQELLQSDSYSRIGEGINQGLAEYAKDVFRNQPNAAPRWAQGESEVDGKWGMVKKDPLEGNPIIKVLQEYSEIGRSVFANKPPFDADPWRDNAQLNTLRALSEAFAQRTFLFRESQPAGPTDFLLEGTVIKLYEAWAEIGANLGASKQNLAEFQDLIDKLKEQSEKKQADAMEVAKTLSELSATTAGWNIEDEKRLRELTGDEPPEEAVENDAEESEKQVENDAEDAEERVDNDAEDVEVKKEGRGGGDPVMKATDSSPAGGEKEKKKPTKPPKIGPPRGASVKISRPESFWNKEVGKVVNVDQGESVYPVTVRFEKGNYAGVFTNSFSLDEVEVISKK